MHQASMRDLRNHGGDVVDRAARGERIAITKDGKPVAELRPLSPPSLSAEALIAKRRTLPLVDAELLRVDIDAVADPSL